MLYCFSLWPLGCGWLIAIDCLSSAGILSRIPYPSFLSWLRGVGTLFLKELMNCDCHIFRKESHSNIFTIVECDTMVHFEFGNNTSKRHYNPGIRQVIVKIYYLIFIFITPTTLTKIWTSAYNFKKLNFKELQEICNLRTFSKRCKFFFHFHGTDLDT